MSLEVPQSADFFVKNGESAERSERLKSIDCGNLFPVLPDEITVNHIVPRVSWRTLLILGGLNRAWKGASKSPDVYEVRERVSSAQTIVIIHQYECTICLYDTATDTWHRLPRPPFGGMLVARGCACVCVHGKLYILGGNRANFQPRNEVHMFDLSGPGQWKQCASMKTARKYFACGVKDGRIYVFGGSEAGNAGEVYDPKQDLWRDVAPMLSSCIEHRVVSVGDTFCVQMGRFYSPDNRPNHKWPYSHSAEMYDPCKDQWTRVENFTVNSTSKAMVAEAVVVIDGRLHMIFDDCLYVYEEPVDSGKMSEPLKWDGSGTWKAVQEISWDALDSPGAENQSNIFARWSVAISVNHELFILVYGQTPTTMDGRKWILLKSQGLGCKNQKLVWKRIQCSIGSLGRSYGDGSGFPLSPCMCTIAGSW